MAHPHKTKPQMPNTFTRAHDDVIVADFRALVVNDLPRARALVARFFAALQDPVLLRFAEAEEDDESSAEADTWAKAELDEVLAEGTWHTADEVKQVLMSQ